MEAKLHLIPSPSSRILPHESNGCMTVGYCGIMNLTTFMKGIVKDIVMGTIKVTAKDTTKIPQSN
jgi:hypothetical protein